MKHFCLLFTALVSVVALPVVAGDKVYFPGQAGNDNLEVRAEVISDPAQIKQEVGGDLGPGAVVMRVKTTNKTGEVMHVGTGDFTLISRKDGDRADALAPGQLAGGSALVLKQDHAGREWAQQTNKPGWLGVAGTKTDKPKDDALLASLKEKELPEQDLKPNESVSGLVYFTLTNPKFKIKDLSLLYKGPGGHLDVDFK